ncbi:MAG: homoserine dehydrogenase [Ruminococcaceae bacterium]|nr:homoserine dehydrogenase [Oscillospiraceae bacterium]
MLLYIAIMGHGVVGSGVAEVISRNNDLIVKRNNLDSLEVKHILDLREFPELSYSDRFTKNFDDILNDDDVKIVVETMGGLNPAYKFVKACLEKGKSVVTSNKELVAAHGWELLKIAEEKNINFLFEASVGGGIPVIRPISRCMAANEITRIAGILNGTTNFILTKMITENMSLKDALKLAQDNGYAEKDPTNDIEGFDACRKICILASLCFGRHVFPDDIPTEGITKISLADVEYAKNYGKVIKLLGTAIRSPDDKVSAEVSPALIDATGPLANVNDVFNAVLVDGNAVGEVVFYGKGAGKLPTASAVVADVIDCAVSKGTKIGYTWDEAAENNLVSSSEMLTRLYVRGFASDVEKAKASVREIFAGAEFISRENAPGDEIAFITPSDIKRKLLADIESIDGFDSQSVIRLF